jgi:esterase/lipase superfamily enzyme
MPLVAYGHYGPPVLMLPTAAADFLEYERFNLVDSVKGFIDQGKAKIYSINSVNRFALLNKHASPQEKIEWLDRYDGYVIHEVLPLIRNDCDDQSILPVVAGISLGAYLAADIFFRHADLFGGAILMSGSYDIRSYLDGYYDQSVYFHNPVDYLPNLDDHYHLPTLQHGGRRIIIYSGEGSYEAPERSRRLAEILSSRSIPHWLDIWGHDVSHDWPWWRQAFPYYFGKLFG